MHYVLVPGAWHGGWSWHPVGRRLRDSGHGATALTMPGLSLGDDPTGLRLSDAVLPADPFAAQSLPRLN